MLPALKLPSGETLQARVDARKLSPGSPVTLGLRPEDAEVGTHTQHLVRPVQWQERLGESTYLYIDSSVPREPWVVKAPGNTFAKAGERVAISLPAQHLHVFDAQDLAVPRTVIDSDLHVNIDTPATA